ncbi:hypothetical protein SCLCIDRAFT_119592 [Scleroderma citrinum Foug A]|uniref:Uncharacterized protein n=1 Tax=Scleroderma citrinum Foug A TaxID=1036808 RepID=A0A0C3DPE2_9AGAM|nr:hypothetical protein SCLCIDRAFT_119592 [Scleroderma citrinum Foug A]
MTSSFLELRLPPGASAITDVDEEIFLLYTALNRANTKPLTGPDGYRGLGHVDSRKDMLTIQFTLTAPTEDASCTGISEQKQSHKSSTRKQVKKRKSPMVRSVEIEIAQDKTALRSRKGDTGSVVWRASVEFARAFLQQYYFPSADAVFDHSKLAECHCLELGSGTGLLGVVLSPLFCSYTATDIAALLPLIRKNVSQNFDRDNSGARSQKTNLSVEELDWLTLSSLSPGLPRARYCPRPVTSESNDAWDLVLVVDCIYHPSLLSPLVDTIGAVSTPGRTWVLVVVELRQEDVVREFLDLWLKHDVGNWSIARIDLLDENYAVWAGHRGTACETFDTRPV